MLPPRAWVPAVPLKRESFIQPGSEEWNSELSWFAKTKPVMHVGSSVAPGRGSFASTLKTGS